MHEDLNYVDSDNTRGELTHTRPIIIESDINDDDRLIALAMLWKFKGQTLKTRQN